MATRSVLVGLIGADVARKEPNPKTRGESARAPVGEPLGRYSYKFNTTCGTTPATLCKLFTLLGGVVRS